MDAKQIKRLVQDEVDRFNKRIKEIQKENSVEVMFNSEMGFFYDDRIAIQSIRIK